MKKNFVVTVLCIAVFVLLFQPKDDVAKKQQAFAESAAPASTYENAAAKQPRHDSKILETSHDVLSTASTETETFTVLNNYQLVEPEQTLELMLRVSAIEYCIGYFSILQQHGSIETYANAFVNTFGSLAPEAILQQYIPAKSSCMPYSEETETTLLQLIEQLLYHAAELGNETAKMRFATMLSTKAVFGGDLYDSATRKQQYKQAITLYRELANKGHANSQATLVVMLTDSVNFPEHYDINEASELVEQIKANTGRDFTHLLYR